MKIRGLRGAITVDSDTVPDILDGTTLMLRTMIEANGIDEDDVASILFTTTPDLTACYPAKAARDMGWSQVALMGFAEMNVPGGLAKCVRVLIHWNTDKRQDELVHVFMRGAEVLRPDLKTDSIKEKEA